MNLKYYLLIRIVLVVVICLLITTGYVLYQADKHAKNETLVTLESIGKQLEIQLFRMDMGLNHTVKFPDFTLWKETQSAAGVCLRFEPEKKGVTQGICRGTKWSDKTWPQFFETAYRLIFNPGHDVVREITYKNEVYGVIHVIPSAEMELNRAWGNMLVLLELSMMTVVAVCTLVYLSISRALLPAQIIVNGLNYMQQGDLSFRLPDFDLMEWQTTSHAINELAASQQQLIAERKQLTFKLITLQDEERRFLARELHDELGQCLAAMNALATSISQTAKDACPQIIDDANSITQINQRMMNSVRTILVRLRPTDIDELGLELSLNSLISEWNSRSKSKTHFQLKVDGDCQQLSQSLSVTLFRITQECLTNINKHSSAKMVNINLKISERLVELAIHDDGNIDTLPFVENAGFGLLGIRERADSLKGKLKMIKNDKDGLSLIITFPRVWLKINVRYII